MSNKKKNVSFPQTPSVSSANWSVQGNFTPTYQMGWVCPKCGAVMSPTVSVCINCNGHSLPSWPTPYVVPCDTATIGTAKTSILEEYALRATKAAPDVNLTEVK